MSARQLSNISVYLYVEIEAHANIFRHLFCAFLIFFISTHCHNPVVFVCVFFFVCCASVDPQGKAEDTLVLKLGSLSMAPQADNPLPRTVLRKDIYQ